MEQYLVTYLTKKYGLKKLVEEQTRAIIRAVTAYSEVDQEVRLFMKVLSHQVDEDFRLRQQELIRELDSQLRHCLKSAHLGSSNEAREKPKWSKTHAEVDREFSEITSGKTTIDSSVWTMTVSRLFGEGNAE